MTGAGRAAAALAAAGLLLCGAYGVEVARDTRLVAPAPTPLVTDRHGGFLTQAGHVRDGRTTYGYWTTPPPPAVVAATLVLEDRRFWSHPGVDPAAVGRAVWSRLHGGRSGASTLAMQVVRMQHPRPRTLWAKAVEAGAALAVTARYGREAVLAQYLRLTPYGNGSHGVGHAARWHFGKPAADLSLAEAALLAAVPQAPALANLHRPAGLRRAAARAARALAAMDLSPAERDAALLALPSIRPVPAPQRPTEAMHAALRLAAASRDAGVDGADPRLVSTLDLRRQAAVSRMARAELAAWRGRGAEQAAVMVVRRRTMEVLASVGSAGWRSLPGGATDFTATLRSPGSALKPFLYGLALDRDLADPRGVLADTPEGSGGMANADHAYLGLMLPRQALANSRNVPAAVLLRRAGLADAFGFLRDAGLHRLDGGADRFGLSMAIGALPTRLDWLVQGYGALANDGLASELRWFTQAPPHAPGSPPRRVLSEDSARLVAAFLSDPLARLPSFPRYGPSEYPFAVALKTGTSQGYRDAWTVAWSDEWIVGAWVGRPDAGPMRGLTGGRTAARLVQAVLLDLHGANRGDLQAGALPAPRGRLATEICTDGQPGPCSARLSEWVRPGPPLPMAPAVPRLAIVQPAPDQHVWRNPDAPPAFNRLTLRATAHPPVPQVVWLVNGEPAATLSPDQPFLWPMTPGRHQFQVRLPLQGAASAPVRVVVE